MDWKAIFGDKESLSLSELEKALEGKKLVDLSEGGYVSKEKFDDEARKAKKVLDEAKAAEATARKELDELKRKTEGEDGLEGQLKKLADANAELAKRLDAADAAVLRANREKLVATKVSNPKLAKLALIEAEALVSDDLDFAAALDKVIADDKEYTAPAATVKTGDAPKGEPLPDDLKSVVDSVFDGGKPKE